MIGRKAYSIEFVTPGDDKGRYRSVNPMHQFISKRSCQLGLRMHVCQLCIGRTNGVSKEY